MVAITNYLRIADLFEVLLISIPFSLLFFYCTLRASRRSSKVPVNWPFFGMLPAVTVHLDRLHVWATEVLPQARLNMFFYGPWFSGMDYFVTCDPANIHHIFTSNFPNYPKGEALHDITDVFGNGIFNSDGESWKYQRLKAHAVLSTEKYRYLVSRFVRSKTETSLLPILDEIAGKGTVVDMEDVSLRLLFDITYYALFEVDPGCLSPGFPTIPFTKAADETTAGALLRHALPPSCWKAMRWLNIGVEKKIARARRVIDQFLEQSIAENKKNCRNPNHEQSNGFISAYIAEAQTMNEEITDKFLRDTALNFLTAGRDATGVGLAWFFHAICEHPDVETKIYDELKSKCPKVSSGGLTSFDPDEVKDLVYLHAALCESLRLYTPIPFEHKAAVKSDVLPSGHELRAGMKILICFHTMARIEEVWGKDCAEFRPERWISEKGRLRFEPSYKFVSFNTGPRTCLGKQMAFTMMKAVAAGVIYNFHIDGVEGHVVEPKISIILSTKNGLPVRLTRRRST